MTDTSSSDPSGQTSRLSPRLTVVSAWYNRTDDLDASVQSVLDQKGVDFEYIIVDDCSTDETSARLAAIEHPRLRVIRNEANIGFTRSIIAAIAAADGCYVAIHGAGDISLPGRLAAQVAFLEAHPDHVAVGTGCENHDLATGTRSVLQMEPASSGRNRYLHGEVMFRRADYAAVGGYRPLFYYAQDNDLWRRLGERGPLGRIEDVLYERRIFRDGVHSNAPAEVKQALFSNLAVWSSIERRKTGIDPVDRRYGRALVEQKGTQRFRARISALAKGLLKERRFEDLRNSLGVIPGSMMSGKQLALYVILRLFGPRWPDLETPPQTLFTPPEGDGPPVTDTTQGGASTDG